MIRRLLIAAINHIARHADKAVTRWANETAEDHIEWCPAYGCPCGTCPCMGPPECEKEARDV